MGFAIDTSTEFGAKTARRVVEEKLAWLTTVDRGGTPQPNPVWFLWDGGAFVVFTGRAEIVDRATIGQELLDRYAEKYAEGMERIELPREKYEAAYTAVIRF